MSRQTWSEHSHKIQRKKLNFLCFERSVLSDLFGRDGQFVCCRGRTQATVDVAHDVGTVAGVDRRQHVQRNVDAQTLETRPPGLPHGEDLGVTCTRQTLHTEYTYIQEEGRKEGNVLFNHALNTFYLRLYGEREKCFISRCTQHILSTVIWRQTYG